MTTVKISLVALTIVALVLVCKSFHPFLSAPSSRVGHHLLSRSLRDVTANTVQSVREFPYEDTKRNHLHSTALLYRRAKLSDEGEEEQPDEEAEPTTDDAVSDISDDAKPIEEQISLLKEGIKFPTNLNGSDVRVGIIMARWNADVVQGLYKGINESLTACGVTPANTFTTYVPGSFELPITAKFLAASKRVDVIICVGCLIKGDTMHFEYIADAVAHGIMKVSLESYVPCIFGVLTVLNKEQAVVRSSGEGNEGLSWGRSAVEMGLARMSAMGMDQKRAKGADAQTPYVNFNATMPTSTAPAKPAPAKIAF